MWNEIDSCQMDASKNYKKYIWMIVLYQIALDEFYWKRVISLVDLLTTLTAWIRINCIITTITAIGQK